MFGANKLKVIFFSEAQRGQEGNITQYLSQTDLIHLSQVSTEANRLSKAQIRQICFSCFIQFMSHPDILGQPIIDKVKPKPIVISRYPNENDLIDLKKGNNILNVLDRITSPLFLDLNFSLNDKIVKAPFELLLIQEIFLLSELHESIHDRLKKICYLYSECLLKNIISAIEKNTTLDSAGKLDPAFFQAVKKYNALPYKTAYLNIMQNLRFELHLKIRKPISELFVSPYDANNLNDEALQFLFEHKIIYFPETRYQYHGHDYFHSPIMEAAYCGNLRLFEFLSRALPSHNNYWYHFFDRDEYNSGTDYFRSPLMAAARANRTNIVTKILENEKTVASALIKLDGGCWTALMHASCKGCVEVVELIIQKASSLGLVTTLVNFCGRINHTALIVAAYNGKLKVVQQLLPYIEQRIAVKGNIDQKQQCFNQVEVALKLARNQGHKAIVDFLQSSLQEEEKPASRQCRLM